MIKEEPWDRNLRRLEHAGDLVGIIGFPEGFVGVGDVDVQAEGFPGRLCRVNPAESTLSVGWDILDMQLAPGGPGGEIRIPCIRLIGGGVADLAANGGIVASIFHQVAENWKLDRFDLVETFHPGVVGIAPGEHHVTGRVAVADLDMGVVEAEAFAGQLIDVRGRSRELTAKSADRVTGHVIHGDQEEIGLCSHGCGESQKKEQEG